MIEDNCSCFGPKRKGPNILINKYLQKEESFFYKLKRICNIEEDLQYELNSEQ